LGEVGGARPAPEPFDPDRRRLGPETDLYQVGLLAWQWACGTPPYTGDDPVEVARSHRRRPLPPFEADFPVPEDFARWVKRLLARDPEK
jgi:serine/threonine-protein kinase